MNKMRVLPSVLVAMAWLVDSTLAMDLSAVTLFGCDDRGVVDSAFRTNSGPLDAAWDVFLYEGPVHDPASVDQNEIQWLNDRENHTIRVPLTPGTHTFTMHSESAKAWPMVGMNLFFDGAPEAAISVMASMDTQGETYPVFTPNDAPRTMGWPITDIPGAGSLRHTTQSGGLWEFVGY